MAIEMQASNFLKQWVPIGAVLMAVGAAFTIGAVYSELSSSLGHHQSIPSHTGAVRKETFDSALAGLNSTLAIVNTAVRENTRVMTDLRLEIARSKK